MTRNKSRTNQVLFLNSRHKVSDLFRFLNKNTKKKIRKDLRKPPLYSQVEFSGHNITAKNKQHLLYFTNS